MKRIVMVAAENAAVPGGKVGGIGDVVRDIPLALCELGHQVDLIMPGYQHFSTLPGVREAAEVTVEFRGEPVTLKLYKMRKKRGLSNFQTWIIDHPMMAPMGAGRVYCDDPDERPFATDASKFALFCLAVVQAINDGHFKDIDAIHLHDWHAAVAAILIRYHPHYQALRAIKLVYTIHNLSLQGVRPFSWDESALENWFRRMPFDYQAIRDPYFDNCYNPMRAAINLCDKVHAVSPSYAQEIQRRSQPALGFVGGEGLHEDLQRASHEDRLIGILNGCEYAQVNDSKPSRSVFIRALNKQLTAWQSKSGKGGKGEKSSVHKVALASLRKWESGQKSAAKETTGCLLTSVGRITNQKVQILFTRLGDNRFALEHLLDLLSDQDVLILLGSGQDQYEQQLADVAKRNSKLIFLHGYSDRLAELLYQCGDLFLMPSSFEPCGISQMLAMRAGQPCLVHHVGGLIDTVRDGVDGFAFTGESPIEQAENLLQRLAEALLIAQENPKQWSKIKLAASKARFLWRDAASAYVKKLYGK